MTAALQPLTVVVGGRRPRRPFVERFDLAGYTNCPPSAAAAQEDADACAASTCPNCGSLGLRYSPWCLWDDPHDEHPASYRAFAVCPVCRHVEEF